VSLCECFLVVKGVKLKAQSDLSGHKTELVKFSVNFSVKVLTQKNEMYASLSGS